MIPVNYDETLPFGVELLFYDNDHVAATKAWRELTARQKKHKKKCVQDKIEKPPDLWKEQNQQLVWQNLTPEEKLNEWKKTEKKSIGGGRCMMPAEYITIDPTNHSAATWRMMTTHQQREFIDSTNRSKSKLLTENNQKNKNIKNNSTAAGQAVDLTPDNDEGKTSCRHNHIEDKTLNLMRKVEELNLDCKNYFEPPILWNLSL